MNRGHMMKTDALTQHNSIKLHLWVQKKCGFYFLFFFWKSANNLTRMEYESDTELDEELVDRWWRSADEGNKWIVTHTQINFGQYLNPSHFCFSTEKQWENHLLVVAEQICISGFARISACSGERSLSTSSNTLGMVENTNTNQQRESNMCYMLCCPYSKLDLQHLHMGDDGLR